MGLGELGSVEEAHSERYLYCFVHIEKCGGSTLIDLLRRNFGLCHVDLIPRDRRTEFASQDDFEWALKLYPGAFSVAGHSIRPFGQFGRLRERMKFYTVLRDPIQRYASDYLNDCRARGFAGSIADWSAFKSQHNLQTRALSQSGSVSEAKEVLERDMAFFETVENYDHFVFNLRRAVAPRLLDTDYQIRNVSDKSLGQPNGHNVHALTDLEFDLAQKANSKDIELYEWARQFLDRKQKALAMKPFAAVQHKGSSLNQSANVLITKFYRNFVYKPSCGLWPAEVDILPRYRLNAADYSSMLFAAQEEEGSLDSTVLKSSGRSSQKLII